MDHYIGIDVGTGSARACIINSAGDIVGEGSENIDRQDPEHGFHEQSTTNIWQSVCISVKDALKENNTDPGSIRGIGFDATCSLAVFHYETDEPVSVTYPDFKSEQNVILWLDQRPIEETMQINNTADPDLLRYVGSKMSPEMEICKVLWLKNHMPQEMFDKCSFYDLADALVHIAAGTEDKSFQIADRKSGSMPVGIDGSVKGWKENFLRAIGLGDLAQDGYKRIGGVNKSGEYRSAGELAGHLCEKAASDLGLPPGIPIGSGVIDAYAGWIGTVGAKVDLGPGHMIPDVPGNDEAQALTRLAAVAGTSTCHLALSPDQIFVDRIWGPFHDVVLPGYCITEGGQTATGELLRHVVENHPAYGQAKYSMGPGESIYDYLDGHLKDMMRGQNAPFISYLARHFSFYGDLYGNRSPVADPSMAGSVIGLTSDNSVDSLAIYYYATLEFIALQTKHIVETMSQAGHRLKSIFMSGSQCKNEILVALIASACNRPVVIPKYVDSAVCHGSAMMGAKAASATEDGRGEKLWDIMNRMSKPGRSVMPTQDARQKSLLEAKYRIFLEQCNTQQKYRKSIDEVVNNWA
ncbi:sugar kinase [Penicillium chermesinum]|uniref:Sugar kinase n=1 Tax=Penicillium chermesinum TaxID=63820 RepID=A0A9W9TJL6_9EURO|nr:sugar kinase [Penicillium chermesinum]KAJ5225153.1 sugar kinase [Penicillium chermesinum]